MKLRSLLLLVLTCVTARLFAQPTVEGLPAVSQSYVIVGATVHPQPGEQLTGTSILVENGLITALGADLSIPGEAILIQADSMHVYAGFIDGLSHVGMEEPKEDEEEQRPKDPGNPPADRAGIQPQRLAMDLLDPKEKGIKQLRNEGFTISHVVPKGKMLPGQGAIVLLGGDEAADMRLRQPTSLFVQYEGAGRMYPSNLLGVMATFKQTYRQAAYALAHERGYQDNPVGMMRPAYERHIQAMYPLVEGKMPAFFLAPTQKDAYRALNLQQELGFPLVLAGVEEGGQMAEALVAQNIPVFVSLDLPDAPEAPKVDSSLQEWAQAERAQLALRRQAAYEQAIGQARMLHEAGVSFGFSTIDVKAKDLGTNLRRLVQEGGLPEEVALAALTTGPAAMLGIEEQAGRIELGRMANLIITDLPFFAEKAQVQTVMVDGKPYEVKQKKASKGTSQLNIQGTWRYVVESPQGKNGGELIFTGEAGAYEGRIISDRSGQEAEVENLELSGQSMSFSYEVSFGGGNTFDVEVVVEVDGDQFEGSVSVGQFGTFPIEGTRTSGPE